MFASKDVCFRCSTRVHFTEYGCAADCTIPNGWRCDYNFVGETSICHQPVTPVIGFELSAEVQLWSTDEGGSMRLIVVDVHPEIGS